MPLVVLRYKPGRFDEEIIRKLAESLPEIVANALSLKNPNERLSSFWVEVWVQEGSELDANGKDFGVIVWADAHSERLANLEQRRDTIVRNIREFLGHVPDRCFTGSVWLLLQTSAGSFMF